MTVDKRGFIAGVDEAGRGALAGPVVAAACILHDRLFRRRSAKPRWSPFGRIPVEDILIADSKQMSPAQRERAFVWITAHCAWGVGVGSKKMIDEDGILAATEFAMREAVRHLRRMSSPVLLLVDGRDRFSFDVPHRSIIRGDATEPCIAAASIIAKVTRDRMLVDLHNEYPQYDFCIHKGYGTQRHIDAIRAHGSCPIHRRSFLTRIVSPDAERSPRSSRRSRRAEA